MTWTDAELGRLREERAELTARHAELTEAIEHVQRDGSAADGEEYVAAREQKALVRTRLDELDAILAQDRRS
ncbi:hypothetical protein [Nocardia caishijiensis]|uniref:Transcription elongation factor-like protein n=1 Tax=Nocardia caishijiensis TaxID=184756 RepID=A0ABQ6YHA3_9NOCA|nr:hypothetical protein [Nocardia caishijiensis]KAF0844831.1 transcription elongation factor-like protein [Nocardia caishijiensis]